MTSKLFCEMMENYLALIIVEVCDSTRAAIWIFVLPKTEPIKLFYWIDIHSLPNNLPNVISHEVVGIELPACSALVLHVQ